jgi:ribosomal protein S18
MEVWKDIKDYEGLYQISSLGRVKSLSKVLKNRFGNFNSKEKILNSNVGYGGYRFQKIQNKTFSIHRLVAEHFLQKNIDKNIVNHKDLNILNNNYTNLEWVSSRENTHHYELNQKRISKYIGVSFDKQRNKWTSKIKVQGKTINLGRFDLEIDAYNKYLNYAKTEGLSSSYCK